MAKFEIPDSVLKNILEFINRASIQGLNEIQAVNEVLFLLSNPIKEEESTEPKQ